MVGIPLSVNMLLLLLGVLAGYLVYRGLAAHEPSLSIEQVLKQAPFLAVFIALVLLCIVALVILGYHLVLPWRHTPVWLAFYREVLIWGSLLGLFSFLFSLASVIAFHTHHAERWKIAIVGALLVAVVQIVQWQSARQVASKLVDIMTPDGVVLQSHGASCGAASGANILRVFGLVKTERQMAEIFGTTVHGTSDAQIIYGMHTLGVTTRKVEILDTDPAQLGSPAMLFVDHPETGPQSHAVAYMGLSQGKAEIWDPLVGKKWLEREALATIWHGRGLTFTRSPGF